MELKGIIATMKNPLDRLNSRFGQGKRQNQRIRQLKLSNQRNREEKECSEQNLRGRWLLSRVSIMGVLRRKAEIYTYKKHNEIPVESTRDFIKTHKIKISKNKDRENLKNSKQKATGLAEELFNKINS